MSQSARLTSGPPIDSDPPASSDAMRRAGPISVNHAPTRRGLIERRAETQVSRSCDGCMAAQRGSQPGREGVGAVMAAEERDPA